MNLKPNHTPFHGDSITSSRPLRSFGSLLREDSAIISHHLQKQRSAHGQLLELALSAGRRSSRSSPFPLERVIDGLIRRRLRSKNIHLRVGFTTNPDILFTDARTYAKLWLTQHTAFPVVAFTNLWRFTKFPSAAPLCSTRLLDDRILDPLFNFRKHEYTSSPLYYELALLVNQR